ncbi:hypothetical protein IGI04_037239 [Brassica rapa subsp. trilocularis]|uniref:Uncharacterized protein n=1 Tax=Brassica rapa subsp. trilocularis TaxID=1813537 RepID=A0ABQ7LJS6_BRACM|nr:hypothetical protein IGI04_037239 [Brassica rapa subsp. trilocularis]
MIHKSPKDQAQTTYTSPKTKMRVTQKETRGKRLDTPPAPSKLPPERSLESRWKHEPSPEFDDIKSSPDHPNHLSTGNFRELTTITEKPPPRTVLEVSEIQHPPLNRLSFGER